VWATAAQRLPTFLASSLYNRCQWSFSALIVASTSSSFPCDVAGRAALLQVREREGETSPPLSNTQDRPKAWTHAAVGGRSLTTSALYVCPSCSFCTMNSRGSSGWPAMSSRRSQNTEPKETATPRNSADKAHLCLEQLGRHVLEHDPNVALIHPLERVILGLLRVLPVLCDGDRA
jgi:hypothetical protein